VTVGPVRVMGAGMALQPCVEKVHINVNLGVGILACCIIVPCSPLTDPNNGAISCSLRDGGAPSYEDTCSFKCNTGYELTGSDTRTCQSDGSWSGIATMCSRGILM